MAKKFRNRLLDSRLLLLAGFGSLLLMPWVAFLYTQSELAKANYAIEGIKSKYLLTNKLLNALRNDVIIGGTQLRDFLLEPNPNAAYLHRNELTQTRAHALSLLKAKQLQEGGAVYGSFVAAYSDYWKVIEPVLQWDKEKRRAEGYRFLRDEVFARRSAMLSMATRIGTWNEDQLAAGAKEMKDLFEEVKNSLERSMMVFMLAGLGLAIFVYWRVTELESQASKRLEQAEHAREEARALSAKLLAVQEEERKSISRELHDEVAQNLSALHLGMEDLFRRLPEAVRKSVETEAMELGRLAEETLKSTRNLSLILRPSMLDDLGLVPALRWLAREWKRRSNVAIEVEASEELDGLSEATRLCVFRVAQEAVNNAILHGAAKNVKIRANQGKEGLLVSIQDDGKSFDAERDKGMGILGMTERVEKLGGKFSIASKSGVGTVVMAELP